jgi:uncharacterized membrane protein
MAADETVLFNKPKKVRLKFIDLARSIAILLMLEGHFVDLTLDNSFRDLSYPAYATWLYIRGFTAPMFLTVTGIVFVYLMLVNRDQPFFGNDRVKKGFKRVVELIFWGYCNVSPWGSWLFYFFSDSISSSKSYLSGCIIL